MKFIVVLAALIALAAAQGNSTSGNATSGHNATSTLSSSTTSLTTASGSTTGVLPPGSTTGVLPPGSTTGVLPPVSVTAITTLFDAGANATSANACANATATFTATFTTGVCALYPIQVPGVNASVRVYWNGDNATMTLWLHASPDADCSGTPVGGAAFSNGGCDFIEVHLAPGVTTKFWVSSRWGALFTTGTTGTTTTTTTTTDTGAGSTVVPSFVAMLFATLLLVARFF